MREFPQTQATLRGQVTDVERFYRAAIEQLEVGIASTTNAGEVANALAAVFDARQRFQELAEVFPQNPHHLDWVAECNTALSRIFVQVGRQEEAQQAEELAATLRRGETLRRWKGDQPLCRVYERMKSLNTSAWSAATEEALEQYREAGRIGELLVTAFPACRQYREWLGATKAGSAKRLSALGWHVDAKADFMASCRLRRELLDAGWRPEIVKCKLANTLCAYLECLDQTSTKITPQKKFRLFTECSQLYRDVLSAGMGLEWVNRYLDTLSSMLECARSEAELAIANDEIEAALSVMNITGADYDSEFRVSTLLARLRTKMRRRQAGVQVSRALQIGLCLVVFLLTGTVSFPLFCLLGVPCILGMSLIGTVEKGFCIGRSQELLRIACTSGCILVAERHGYPLAGFLLSFAAMAMSYAVTSGQLKWQTSDWIVALCARVSRRTDLLADEWARWIEQHGAPILKKLLLTELADEDVPRLRQPLYLLACCCAVSWEIHDLCCELVELAMDALLATSAPKTSLPVARRRTASTSWAVLLRRPLHLARGDDVPLLA